MVVSMPHEHRFIIFSPDEVVQALSSFRRNNADAIPPGRIVGCAPDGNGVTVTVEVGRVGGSERRPSPLTKDQLRDALVKFCIETNVKLPRAVEKRLNYSKGRYLIEMKFDSVDLVAADDAAKSITPTAASAATAQRSQARPAS
jgi:hypothetical protein